MYPQFTVFRTTSKCIYNSQFIGTQLTLGAMYPQFTLETRQNVSAIHCFLGIHHNVSIFNSQFLGTQLTLCTLG